MHRERSASAASLEATSRAPTSADVLALTKNEMRAGGVILTPDVADNPAMQLFADRIQLQQVVLNLIMNAIEAMRSVTDRDRVLQVRTGFSGRDEAVMAVEDTGPGIESKNLASIFDAFFTTKAGGMGMGLSICRSIVEAHGGRLTARLKPGFGSIFEVTLPLYRGVEA
jgi:signal transduction histidine kinase